jgi:hypothetical protein
VVAIIQALIFDFFRSACEITDLSDTGRWSERPDCALILVFGPAGPWQAEACGGSPAVKITRLKGARAEHNRMTLWRDRIEISALDRL